MARVTITDVGRAAGVSIKTVSRVINNEAGVRAETRERVERAIAALNFRPSMAARALSGRKSFQIALIYDNPSPYYVHQSQEGVRARCLEAGVRLIIHPVDVRAPGLVAEIDGLISETHVDGVVLSPPVTEMAAVLRVLEARGVPFVRISPGLDPDAGPAVSMDDVGAARAMTEHLLALGHRRIGFVVGDPGHVAAGQRLQGYREALGAAEIAFDEALVRQGRFDFESGKEAAASLLGMADRPTAIFASNDDMAAGALSAALGLGLAIPADVSVCGFDDTTLARMVWPQLTTVRQPIRDIAYAAADLLLVEGGAERRVMPFELMIRASAGATKPR